jgi:FkbM family methyltransferase
MPATTGSMPAGLPPQRDPPPPPWERMPLSQRLRLHGRVALMASGLAMFERRGLTVRAMPELRLMRHLVPRGRIAVDVGANIGAVASEIARHARLTYAFEANPMPFHVLRRLRSRRLVPIWAAVGAATAEAEFVIPLSRKGPTNNGGHLRNADAPGADALMLAVPVVALDDLDLGDVGFLKIDVEGHEPAVLDGARRLLERRRPTIFVEHEVSHAGGDFGDVFLRLRELDYEGLFFHQSGLRHLSEFDPDIHQNPAESKAAARYVSNFVFLPRR